MNWYNYGLCPYGYHYDDNYNKIKCINCEVVDNLINEICKYERRLAFRALSYTEKKDIYYNVNRKVYRGDFKEIVLDEDSFQGIINKIFECIRITINNKASSQKLFSYSRCFTVPLFKYIIKDDNPVIIMKHLNINTFNISYCCIYYQWIKGYYTNDDEHSYITEGEANIPIKELFNNNLQLNSIEEFLKNIYNKKNYIPYEYYLGGFLEDIKKSGYDDLSLCDLDDVNNIKIQSFTLDLSFINRNIMNNYLRYCSNEEVKIKRAASYNKDREIISTEYFNSYNEKFYAIEGKEFIKYLKLITICILFLEEYKNELNEKYSEIILEYIHKIKSEYINDSDRVIVCAVIQHLRKNYKEEFEALTEIKEVWRRYNESILNWFERLTNVCCQRDSMQKKLIYLLKRQEKLD